MLISLSISEFILFSFRSISTKRSLKFVKKISSDEFVRAITNLKNSGFSKKHIGVYLMYGLPGQSLEEVKYGVQFLKNLDVRINLTEYSPIPGTTCWTELVNKRIISDDIDPLLTNNTVFTYLFSGYSHNELKKLKDDVNLYNSQQVS